jgi:hypothetical protein
MIRESGLAPTGLGVSDDREVFHWREVRSELSGDFFELDRVGLKGVPLADDEIAVFQHADIVPMIENALGLHERA